jgi:hypothetical protein
MLLPLTDVPIPKPNIRLEEMDGELLLYHPAQTKAIYLNQSAGLIWQLSDGKRTLAQIMEILSDTFTESNESITEDVRETIKQFLIDEVVTV